MLINPPAASAATAGFPSPSYYLGAFSGSNPSASANGQWWYRIDLNTIYEYVNGQAVPVMSGGPATFIVGSETIGGANVVVDQDVIVLPSSTLVTYGSIFFARTVKVLPGAAWLSSNPNASSTAVQYNSYSIYGGLYLDGLFINAQYNSDTLAASPSYIFEPGSASINGVLTIINPTSTSYVLSLTSVAGSGTLVLPSGYSVTLINSTISVGAIGGAATLVIPSGYSATLANYYSLTAVALTGSGTLVASGTIIALNFSVSYVVVPTESSVLVAYNSAFPAYSNSDDFTSASWPVAVSGSGLAILSRVYSISDSPNTVSFTALSMSAGTNGSVSVEGKSVSGGIGYVLTSVAGSTTGFYILEIYAVYYIPYGVHIGTASYTYSLPSVTLGSYSALLQSSTGYTYPRNGANSPGVITITGTLYGG